jgi:hypothetical protein
MHKIKNKTAGEYLLQIHHHKRDHNHSFRSPGEFGHYTGQAEPAFALAFCRYLQGFLVFPTKGACMLSIIASVFSLASLSKFKSVGYATFAGVQVASTSSLPLFEGGSSSSLSSGALSCGC